MLGEADGMVTINVEVRVRDGFDRLIKAVRVELSCEKLARVASWCLDPSKPPGHRATVRVKAACKLITCR
jgi:hypothetical protein